MDSLTQVVLGAAVGEAVLGKKVGNKAILWGAVAGTIPDLDVLVKFFTDDVTANEMHRGFSHSIVFCLLFAPVLGFLINRIHKSSEASWRDWSKLSFWSFFTHPLLDAHTTWGTQLLWPLDLRLAYKNINVIDPVYTLPFLFLVVAAMFFKKTNRWRQILNWLGIGVSSIYMLYTIGLKVHVNQVFTKSLNDNGVQFERLTHQPTLMNSVLWMAVAETDSAYYMGFYSILDRDRKVDYISYPKDLEIRQDLENVEMYIRLVKLSDKWYLVRKKDDGFVFKDLRFGQLSFDQNEENIVFQYQLKKEGSVWKAEQLEPPRDTDVMKTVMISLWERIKGKE